MTDPITASYADIAARTPQAPYSANNAAMLAELAQQGAYQPVPTQEIVEAGLKLAEQGSGIKGVAPVAPPGPDAPTPGRLVGNTFHPGQPPRTLQPTTNIAQQVPEPPQPGAKKCAAPGCESPSIDVVKSKYRVTDTIGAEAAQSAHLRQMGIPVGYQAPDAGAYDIPVCQDHARTFASDAWFQKVINQARERHEARLAVIGGPYPAAEAHNRADQIQLITGNEPQVIELDPFTAAVKGDHPVAPGFKPFTGELPGPKAEHPALAALRAAQADLNSATERVTQLRELAIRQGLLG